MNFRDADTLEFGGKGDAAISRTGPDAFTFGNGTEQDATATINVRDLKEQAVSGATQFHSHQAELITLSLSQLTTDSVALLLPANAIIKAVCALVTKPIAGATSWALGDDSTAARFAAAKTTLALGTTEVGLAQWTVLGACIQVVAGHVRITCVGQPTAGQIHVEVFYEQFTPPTS